MGQATCSNVARVRMCFERRPSSLTSYLAEGLTLTLTWGMMASDLRRVERRTLTMFTPSTMMRPASSSTVRKSAAIRLDYGPWRRARWECMSVARAEHIKMHSVKFCC